MIEWSRYYKLGAYSFEDFQWTVKLFKFKVIGKPLIF